MTAKLNPAPESAPIPIVYLIDFFGKGGGTENQLAVLVNNLDRALFSPTIVTLREVKGLSTAKVNCPVHNLNVTHLLSWHSWRALRHFVRFLTDNEVEILQLFFIDSNIFGVIAGIMAGIKTIIIGRRDMGWWYGQRRRLLTNLLNRRASLCIANADAVKRVVMTHEGIPSEKIEVIYNGVPESIGLSASDIRAKLAIPADSSIVTIVANLKPIKRIDRFLRVASAIADTSTHFLVIGQGQQKEELTALAESFGIGERTHFYSTVNEVHAILRECAVGVLTSESEGLSNVLIEYALNGLPAVAFDVGGNREVIVHGETGFVIPVFDEAAMAKSIGHLLADASFAEKLGNRAREEACRRFSVPTMIHHHEQVYLRVITPKKPQPDKEDTSK
ncbi:MAG: glycosyltransferase [Candidatus Zixiibacteriota bacterium]